MGAMKTQGYSVPPVAVIVGPTGVGKSALAVELAERLDGEIINADSRQVYRHMDIGTAKPSEADRLRIRHHLMDVADPRDDFSLGQYLELALKAIQDVHARGKLPILVGGTGQYVWALIEGWQVPPVPPNAEIRDYWNRKAQEKGTEWVYHELQKVDPVSGTYLDSRNLRRVVRALEIFQLTGKRPSELRQKLPPSYAFHTLGLTLPRAELYRRIDRRVRLMVQRGWVAEVQWLLEHGYSLELPAMSSLGYKEVGLVAVGRMSLAQAVDRICYVSHRFARHQHGWFRLRDRRILWHDAHSDPLEGIVAVLRERLLNGSGVQTTAA